jgi:hypothetical protein
MKKAAIGIVSIVVAALAGMGAGPRVGDGQGRNRVEGTWEHTFANEPRLRLIKVINQDHFIWVTYLKETRMPVTTAGGTYTLDGDSYKEQVEFGRFGSPELQEGVGKEHAFRIKIDGDTMTLIDAPTNGNRLREIWKRVKP